MVVTNLRDLVLQDFAKDDGFDDVANILYTKSKQLRDEEQKMEQETRHLNREVEAGAQIAHEGPSAEPHAPLLSQPLWYAPIEAAVAEGTTASAEGLPRGGQESVPSLDKLAADLCAVLSKVRDLPTEDERKLVVAAALAACRHNECD